MPHAVNAAEPGLQAVILCGPGSSFPTFTTNPDANPKALLPIANRPMIWYPLEFCYRAGITDITVICTPSSEKAISSALNIDPYLTTLPHPKPELLAPKDLDLDTGTAEILRLNEVRSVIKKDFVVLPCDLVCELGGDKLLQAWMVKAASPADITGSEEEGTAKSGGLSVFYQTKTETPIKGEETDFMATSALVDEEHMRMGQTAVMKNLANLVYSIPKDSLKDLIGEKGGLPARHGLLRKHPRLKIRTTYRDAHIYIFPHWILDFVITNDRFDSIGEDVIGWWAKSTWQKGLPDKLGMRKVLSRGDEKSSDLTDSMVRENSTSPTEITPPEMRPSIRSKDSNFPVARATVKKQVDGKDDAKPVEVPQILAYVHPTGPKAQLLRRVDTAQLLLHVSLQLAKLPSIEEAGEGAAISPFAHAKKVAYPAGIQSKTTVTRPDSLLADNVTVEQKVSVKECVIGLKCTIGEGAKLSQCLLMDNVVVGKGCKLTRCILGRYSKIGEGSVLTDCEVQENLLVDPQTDDKNNKLMSSSGLDVSDGEADEIYREMEDEMVEVEPGDPAVTG